MRAEEGVWRSAAAAALPVQPSALSDLSCASMRAILQRRAQAKRNIAGNRASTTLQLGRLDRRPVHILFSPLSHDRIAVVLASGQLSMYATQEGTLLWTTSLLPFVAGYEMLENRRQACWHHGETQLKACVGPGDWADAHDICLRIFSFDTDTAALRTSQSLSLAGMEFFKLTGWASSFSHSGGLVSVLMSGSHPDSTSHIVVNADTCSVVLSHNFEGHYLSTLPNAPRSSWLMSTWSQDDQIVATMGQLVHMKDGRRLSFWGKVGGDDDADLVTPKFHPSGHLLGCTYYKAPSHVPSALFVDTSTGDGLCTACCVGGFRFVTFLSKEDHALLLPGDQHDPAVQQYTVFDCKKQMYLRNFACSANLAPRLTIALDDSVVLGHNFPCSSKCLTFCCYSAAGHALHYHAQAEVWQWRLSPDETSLAVCTIVRRRGQPRIALSLVKL